MTFMVGEGGVIAAAVIRVQHQRHIQGPGLQLGIGAVLPQQTQEILRRGQLRQGNMDVIVGMYQAILPNSDSLIKSLAIFNLPFTFVKGMIDVALCFLIYKPLSPILHR